MARSRKKQAKRPLPGDASEWFAEINDAYEDAHEAKPYGVFVAQRIRDQDRFHLAPHVCVKFRGLKPSKKKREEIVETALATYVANVSPSDEASGNRQAALEAHPKFAFTLCYLASHLHLELLDEDMGQEILSYCAEQWDDDDI